MHCRQFEERLNAYIDGELNERTAGEMLRHERECPDCGGLAQRERRMLEALAEMADEEPPAGLHDALMASVRQEAARGKPKRRMNRWGIAGIAAAAVVVCVSLPLAAGLLGGATGGAGMNSAAQFMAAGDMDSGGGYVTYDSAPSADMQKTMEMGYDVATDDADYEMDVMPEEAVAGGSLGSSTLTAGETGQSYGLKLIRSGYVTLETRAFDDDLGALQALVATYEGYIEHSSVSGVPYNADPNSYGRWASLTVRVPSQALDSFLSDAKGIGNVIDSSVGAYDITSSYQDTQLRLETLTTQHKRLTELLAKAEAVEDLIQIESELARVQYEMDSLTGALRSWDNQVDYSSVSISLDEVKTYSLSESVDPSLGERIGQGFQKGLHDFVEGAQNLLVFLVTALPVLLLLAAAVVGGIFLVRHIRKGRKGKPRADDDPPLFEE